MVLHGLRGGRFKDDPGARDGFREFGRILRLGFEHQEIKRLRAQRVEAEKPAGDAEISKPGQSNVFQQSRASHAQDVGGDIDDEEEKLDDDDEKVDAVERVAEIGAVAEDETQGANLDEGFANKEDTDGGVEPDDARVRVGDEIVSVEHLFGGETRQGKPDKARDDAVEERMVHGAPTRVSKR